MFFILGAIAFMSCNKCEVCEEYRRDTKGEIYYFGSYEYCGLNAGQKRRMNYEKIKDGKEGATCRISI